MSGTNHADDEGWTGPKPAVILVRPQMGENIGAAARAMWNFGLDRMRIVNPRDGWPNERAVAMASGAARVLDQVRVVDTVAEAADDLHYIYATTARRRDLTKAMMSPEEAMRDARQRLAQGQNVGVLFGPERSGLENDEVARANAIITVPVNPAFGSLNLAQCVLLVAYEWRRLAGETIDPAPTEQATVQDIEALTTRLEADLDAAHFFFPEEKAASMRTNLRNLFSRLPLTQADVRIFHGILRALRKPRDG